MDRRALAIRFVLGPAIIAATFLFFDRSRPFIEVWKPLLLYYGIAIPAFFLIDRLKKATLKGRPS
jgi:hypothetical protein